MKCKYKKLEPFKSVDELPEYCYECYNRVDFTCPRIAPLETEGILE